MSKINPDPYQEFRQTLKDISDKDFDYVKDEAKNKIIRTKEHNKINRIYRFKLIVLNTNRAAFSEYYCVLRPPIYGYLERIAAVKNQFGNEDINMPYLHFVKEIENGKEIEVLKVGLATYDVKQKVLVIGQRISLSET